MGSPALSSSCVSTRELAACVPFRSSYANEENVHQAIKRLRRTLVEAGIDGLIETVPRHGYYIMWAPSSAISF